MIDESARVQQRLLAGVENVLQVADIDTGTTPHEVVYKEDKVQVYH